MKAPGLKNSFALVLQCAVVVWGIAVLGFLLWEPHLEGRNAHATTFEIYFKDPFLAYVYVGSIPFFVALWRGLEVLGNVRRNETLSPATLGGLRIIQRCALAMIGFVAGGMVFILSAGDPDDRPAGFFMGMLVAGAAGVIAITAARFSRNLQRALAQG